MKKFKEKAIIMDSEQMYRAMKRMAHEIIEKNKTLEGAVVLGIRTRGVPLAERLVKCIKEIHGITLPMGVLDINLYRDDLTALSEQPIIHQTIIPAGIQGKTVILVDDVLYTGRTIRAALDSIIDMGRPSSIQLVVMIDRGHRELPIRADYVGKNVPTSKREKIDVTLREIDGEDKVVIKEQEEE
ncbi:bifunctional pyr operon transcriptional regulator/uracil phosphoribosyltransferase [endosymbiont 'TC1' of Trimyema compressum]|uniref:bifunctional pyr operon transcriptional regulator/uracil phosphoribosyltransferase PyrR n=1 Tax=endosymbiont 'TC1' of Trimyema compressum TaxID=243899 RepID=UPI0007F0F5DF|nr:bifunctional pyr operon transcriptional regulator/uracil phosphoribosyltransferase PyrR [endosymbiont 'TC1' of Trimyema compressum]AMP20195.1 bifunctional pyr operon transcriptional regulator/uracil phosphoribosyltransferase [endosymbiont 'TC1' of Trimyema compressum]